MRDHIDKDFILVEEKDEKGKIIGRKWWFKDPSSVRFLDLVPLGDRLERAVIDVLRRNVKVSFDQVLQEIFIKFPNALTPETQKVRDLLSEYADHTSDGKWALKNIVHLREGEHGRMIFLLASLGKKAGFRIAVGLREQGEVYQGTKLSGLASREAPSLSDLNAAEAERVRQIDVLWSKRDAIRCIFEVEHTTAITEAIVRGSNLPSDSVKRFMVLPEEREKLLHRKLQQPMLADRVRRDHWQFIFYKDLEKLFDKNKAVSMADIENIASDPKPSSSQSAFEFT